MNVPDVMPDEAVDEPAIPPSERTDMIGHAREIVSVMMFARMRNGALFGEGGLTSVELLPHEDAVHRAACQFLVREFHRGYRSPPATAVPAPAAEPSKVIVP